MPDNKASDSENRTSESPASTGNKSSDYSNTPATSDPELLDEPMSSKAATVMGGSRRRSARGLAGKRKIIIDSDNDDDDDGSNYEEEADVVSDDDDSDFAITEIRETSVETVSSDGEVVGGGFVPDEKILEKEQKTRNEKGKAKGKAKSKKQNEAEVAAEVEDLQEPVEEKPKKKRAKRTKKEGEKDDRPNYLKYYDRSNAMLYEHHPELQTIFQDMEQRGKRKPEAIPQPDNIVTKLLPFQREGLNWLIEQEKSQYAGGILADEMGMGKTIQTIALLSSDNSTRPQDQPNLVITPTVALIQWKNEIFQHTGDGMSVYIYHGAGRSESVKDLQSYDVILTTYAVAESVWRKQQSGFKRQGRTVKAKSPLHAVHWHRVVLDEAHNIKDRNSNTSRAVFNLPATYRLCLSGTPLQNRIGEIYSLLRFLKVDPFSFYYCKKCDCKSHEWKFSNYKTCDFCDHRGMDHCNFFNHSLLKHIQHQGGENEGLESMAQIRVLMGQLMLRRTKLERADDLGLPPRVVEVRKDYFNEEEKDLYTSIYSDSNRKFNSYVDQGVVLNNYANIFTLITRMRQVADHPDLVLRKRAPGSSTEADLMKVNALVCKICDDEAEDPIQSKCRHLFCRMCVREYIEGFTGQEKDLECPVCHVGLTIDLSAPAMEVDEEVAKKASIVNRINMNDSWRSSTKIEALVEELYNLRNDRQTIKSIVFSQFTSMLDLVEWRLGRAGFQTVKLQGSMSPTQRDGIIRHFMENPSVEVFLVSLKAGGVALNLCEASQVFILDPWWNPSVEWQSGDRVHRIGQHRPVKITRLIIEDSIESRIVELQDKKASMIHATISQDDSAMNRLTPGDMQFLFQN